MKYNHFDQLWERTTSTSFQQEMYMRACVRAGLRCQICNERGGLACHMRLDGSDDPSDVLVLCADCYDLAEVGKRRRMQSEMKKLLERIVVLMCLFIGVALVFVGLVTLSPLSLIALCLASACTVVLIEVVLTVFRA